MIVGFLAVSRCSDLLPLGLLTAAEQQPDTPGDPRLPSVA